MRAPSPCPPERLVVAAALHEIAHAESARVRAHIETCPSCAGVFARRGAPAILAGKYEVERELGSGGMGRVLLARHMKLNRRVAIKMLHADRVREPRIVERFAREARAAASLRTRHVVHVLDVDESENGEPFMVMEMLSGVDLDDKIAHEGPLPVDVAVRWVIQA